MRAPFKLLLGVVVAGGLLVMVELGLRVGVPLEALLLPGERASDVVHVGPGGEIAGVVGRTLVREDGPYRWRARVNDLGLREAWEALPAADWTALALGDSWIWGFSVTDGATLPDRVEALVEAERPGVDAEVVNAGVFGGSAFDMLLRWRALRQEVRPATVILGMPHNAERQGTQAEERAGWYGEARVGARSDMRLYLLVRLLLAPYRWPTYADPGDVPGGSAAADLVTLAREAREDGAAVWMVLVPVRWEEGGPHDVSGLWRAWVDVLEPEGVRFAGHTLPERACWGWRDEGHPSEAGTTAIATALVEAWRADESRPVPRGEPSCADVEGAAPGR